jgi:hypothetical protein
MADSEPGAAAEAAGALLGLPASATPEQIMDAYRRLRAHVERRLGASEDEAFRAARHAELARLRDAVAAVPGIDPESLDAVRRDGGVRHRLARWGAPLGAAAVGATLTAAVLLAPSEPADERPTPPLAPPLATLVVEADPQSAALTVTSGADARVVFTGAARGEPTALEPGDYGLRIAHPDCPDVWEQRVTLEAGEERRYAPRICQGEGRLVVRSNVAGDRVRIDGLDVGSTGATPHVLRVGHHEVTVDKEGFSTWTGRVRVEPDTELTITAELAAAGTKPPAAPAAPAPPPAPRVAARPPASPPREDRDSAGGMIDPSRGGRPLPTRTGLGGSKTWHDAIRQDLVSQFDRNGSGSLDTVEEVDAISCETWRNIEQSYETGGLAVEMTHLYGFDGSEAPANTLGITAAVRAEAYERMKACGLKARR